MYVSTVYDDYQKKVSWIRNLTFETESAELDLMHVKNVYGKKNKAVFPQSHFFSNKNDEL